MEENPKQPPGMFLKPLQIMGLDYQPQQVSRMSSIKSTSFATFPSSFIPPIMGQVNDPDCHSSGRKLQFGLV